VTLRWYVFGILLAAAVGYLAAVCHLAGLAPVGLVSLAVGVGLGLGAAQLASMFHIACRKRLLSGALLFALIAIFAEHAWLYQDFRRQWREARDVNPRVAMFRPESPWSPAEYLHHEATGPRITLWCIDAMLIAAGSIGVVMLRRTTSDCDVDRHKLVAADDANQS